MASDLESCKYFVFEICSQRWPCVAELAFVADCLATAQRPAHEGRILTGSTSANSAGLVSHLKAALASEVVIAGPPSPACDERPHSVSRDTGHDTSNEAYLRSPTSASSQRSHQSEHSFSSRGATGSNNTYQISIEQQSDTSEKSIVGWNKPQHDIFHAAFRGTHADPWLPKLDHDETTEYPQRLSITDSGSEKTSSAPSDRSEDRRSLPETPSVIRPALNDLGFPSPTVDDITAYSVLSGCCPNEKHDTGNDNMRADGPSKDGISEVEMATRDGTVEDPATAQHKDMLRKRGTYSLARKCVIGLSIVVASLATVGMIVLLSLCKSKKMARASFMGFTLLIEAAVISAMVSQMCEAPSRKRVLTLSARSLSCRPQSRSSSQ
jgi:hypothetical protein